MDILDFDLAHDAEEGVELQLKDPRTDEPLFTKDGRPVTITVAGMNSDAFRIAVEAANRGFVGWPSEMLNSPMFRDRREAADLGVLVAVTLDWQGIEHASVPLDFNDTTVAAVYRRFVWIRDQVTKTIHDPKAFAATRSDWQLPAVAPKPVPQPDISKW